MRAVLIGAACLAMAAATPIAAQEREPPTLVHEMARFIIAGIAETQYESWGYGWSAVSTRVSNIARWHLYSTEDSDSRPGIQRNGWIHASGWNASATACGDEDSVHALALRADYPRVTSAELFDALRAQGATVEIVAQDEESGRVRVTQGARGVRELRWAEQCTSPYSAAAQRCWINYTLELTHSPIASACSVPGR